MAEGALAVELVHPDGRRWRAALAGLTATVETVGAERTSRRDKTFRTRTEAERFVAEGVRRMAAGGFGRADGEVAALRAVADAARGALTAGAPPADAALRERLRWTVTLGDEAGLAALADDPARREAMVRSLAAAGDPEGAAWVAFVAGSPLLVPVLRWCAATDAADRAAADVMPAALRTFLDGAPHPPPGDGLDGLLSRVGAGERWAEWGPIGRGGDAEAAWAEAAAQVVAAARRVGSAVPWL